MIGGKEKVIMVLLLLMKDKEESQLIDLFMFVDADQKSFYTAKNVFGQIEE